MKNWTINDLDDRILRIFEKSTIIAASVEKPVALTTFRRYILTISGRS